MPEPKDCWDKVEVLGKIVVPIAVGAMILVWNSQRTTQQTSATMTDIAIGVLSEQPAEGEGGALRNWAIAVLQSPENPPRLSEKAAFELRTERLRLSLSDMRWGDIGSPYAFEGDIGSPDALDTQNFPQSWQDVIDRMEQRLDDDSLNPPMASPD